MILRNVLRPVLGRVLRTAIWDSLQGLYSKYYQWLPLGLEDAIINKGTGLVPLNGVIISGSMATQDIVFDWVVGDVAQQALADYWGIDNPISYAQMIALLTEDNLFIKSDENAISEMYFKEFLKIFNQAPVQIGNNWGNLNEANPQNNDDVNIIVYANSIAEQSGTSDRYRWVYKLKYYLEKYYGVTVTTVNEGYDGNSGLALLNNYASRVPQHYDPIKRNIVIGFEVINDLTNVTTPATDQEAYEHLRDISQLVQADGAEFILATALNNAGTSVGQNIRIPLVNQICKDNPTDWDAIWDMNAIPELQDPTDLEYFFDGTHPTQLGSDIQAMECAKYLAVTYLGRNADGTIINKTSGLNINQGNCKLPFAPSTSLDFGEDSFACFATFRINEPTSNVFGAVTGWGAPAGGTSFYLALTQNISTPIYSVEATIRSTDNIDRKTATIPITLGEINRAVVVVDRASDTMTLYNKLIERPSSIAGISGDADPAGDMYIGSRDYNSTADIDLFHIAYTSGLPSQTELDAYLYQEKFTIQNPSVNIEFEHQSGDEVLENGINKLTASISNIAVRTWMEENSIEPKGLTKGCTVYYDGVSEYKIVNYDNVGNPQNKTIAGFSVLLEAPANSGFLKGITNTVTFPDTAELAAFDARFGTDFNGSEKTFAEIQAILATVIPASDFGLDIKDGVITNWRTQPNQQMINLDGKMANLDGRMYNIKTF